MPARTNDFQRLVKQVQQALAPAGAKVTESAILSGASGVGREIDVLVEGQFGSYLMKIAVEAKDHKRPLDLPAIEQLAGKYRPGDGVQVNQIVVVAGNGFTQAAMDFSSRSGIRLLTLKEACQADWKGMIPQQNSKFGMRLPPHIYDIRIEPVPNGIDKSVLLRSRIACTCCGREHGTLLEFAKKWVFESQITQERVQRDIREGLAKAPCGVVELHFTCFPKSWQLIIGDQPSPISKIMVDVRVMDSTAPLNFKNFVQISEDGTRQFLQQLVANIGNSQFQVLIPQASDGKWPDKIVVDMKQLGTDDKSPS